MIITEEEAKAKRCCGPHDCGTQTAIRRCIGSACMAWAWQFETTQMDPAEFDDKYGADETTGIPWVQRGADSSTVWPRAKNRMGLCGLAR